MAKAMRVGWRIEGAPARALRDRDRARRVLARWIAGLVVVLAAAPAYALTVQLEATADNTLIETPDGSTSNGSGPYLFAGRVQRTVDSIRRAVLRFDVSVVPGDAIVQSVRLSLVHTKGRRDPVTLALHRVEAAWGEGGSLGTGGTGDAAQAPDATWLHRRYGDTFWTNPGGDFAAAPSADAFTVEGAVYHWSSAGLLADVLGWRASPQSNYGWILLGDESAGGWGSVAQFGSREAWSADEVPLLEVTYQTVPEPGTSLLLGVGIAALALRRRGAVARG